MKNIINILLLAVSPMAFSQVIIGDETGTAQNKTSVLLEFSEAEKKGIILPYVKTLPQNPVGGTLILDATSPTSARVKYYNGEWRDLTNNDQLVADVSAELSHQPNIAETQEAKVIIGADTSSADGVLVLESTDKAMVLPTVASVNDIVNPSPGMIVYLSEDNLLAVYNGRTWSFWGDDYR